MCQTAIQLTHSKRKEAGNRPCWRRIDPFNVRTRRQIDHVDPMKISDFTCPSCLASYEVAESLSVKGNPGRAQCSVCGGLLASWQEPRLRAYRLILAPEHKYSNVPVPPVQLNLKS